MNIIILGASGYLGGEIANKLSNKNVFACSRNVINPKLGKIKFIRVKNYSYLTMLKFIKNMDIVIHAVCLNKIDSQRLKKKSILLKKKITQNILKACIANRVKKLIYISTIQVYGNYYNKKKICEKSLTFPLNFYSKAHLEAENLIKKSYKVNYIICRVSNVFGFNFFDKNMNNEKFKTIINNLFLEMLKKKLVMILNPNTLRNFIPITVFLKIIKKLIYYSAYDNKIINIGYCTMSLYDISKLIQMQFKNIFKKKIKLIFLNKYLVRKNKKFDFLSNVIKIKYNKKLFVYEIKKSFFQLKNKYEF